MNIEICANCSKLKGKNVESYFIRTICGARKLILYNENTGDVLCEPRGEVREMKFKLYGNKALCLYEHSSDCPFHFEHIVFDGSEREEYLKNIRNRE